VSATSICGGQPRSAITWAMVDHASRA
jgi:hypothetical protein